jgi:hypothetical protein
MKLLSFLTLTALLSFTSCSHFTKSCCKKEQASCTKEKCDKPCCDKEKKCADNSCQKKVEKCDDSGSCHKKS